MGAETKRIERINHIKKIIKQIRPGNLEKEIAMRRFAMKEGLTLRKVKEYWQFAEEEQQDKIYEIPEKTDEIDQK